jgi:hypothetical protein
MVRPKGRSVHSPGSGHFFPEARKVDIDLGNPLVIADIGAGTSAVAHRWFRFDVSSVQEIGVAFTAIGIVTLDPASVESVLS